MNAIAVFDVGKTNKKLLLFDEDYRIIREQCISIQETIDEDGEPCEDLGKLTDWILSSLKELNESREFRIRAINFSAYGASLVHIGKEGQPLTPLYNYLKPYPADLSSQFYNMYGGEEVFSLQTASPVLGSLNSGMQLIRIKEQQPALFASIKCSLHLPQYFSYLLTGIAWSDITSIGCHTNLWNFSRHHYHEWIYKEGIMDKLAPMASYSTVLPLLADGMPYSFPRSAESGLTLDCVAGSGLHDSSAAMIPYLESFREPFVLISTGTWCISMNPFISTPLTAEELKQDCLCYMSYKERPVKASRLFAGQGHEKETARLADCFGKPSDHYRMIQFDPGIIDLLRNMDQLMVAGNYEPGEERTVGNGQLVSRDWSLYEDYEIAYHRLMMDIMDLQVRSTQLVIDNKNVKRIFVDGGFGKNPIYMHLLAAAFPRIEVYAASMPQATALGAALALHDHWNTKPLRGDLIELKYYK